MNVRDDIVLTTLCELRVMSNVNVVQSASQMHLCLTLY